MDFLKLHENGIDVGIYPDDIEGIEPVDGRGCLIRLWSGYDQYVDEDFSIVDEMLCELEGE